MKIFNFMKLPRCISPLLAFAIALAGAQMATASIIVFEDNFNYSGWSSGADPMNAVWTRYIGGDPVIGDGSSTSGFPDTYLYMANRGVYVDLPNALTTDWSLSVTMTSSLYGRYSWFGLTDGTGQNGYYVGWDAALIGQYNGWGRIGIGEMSNATPGYANPGTVNSYVSSGAIAAVENSSFESFASVTLTWIAATNTLQLYVNGVLKQTVVDDSVTSFSRIYLTGNTAYYGEVVLTTVPEPAAAAGIMAILSLGFCVFVKSRKRGINKACLLASALMVGPQLFLPELRAEDAPVRPGADAIALIRRAVDERANEVILPRGVYRFQGNERMVLSRLENFRIDGSGSTFLFDPDGKFTVTHCRNLRVENIIIDYDPLPFTQGVVVGVNADAKSILARFDEGFPAPGSPGFPRRITRADGTVRGSIRFLDAAGRHMHAMLGEDFASINPRDGGTYEIKLSQGRLFRPGVGPGALKVGDRFTLFVAYGEALDVTHCERIVFKNIDIYSAPGFGVGEKGGKGGNIYENLRLIRKPGSERLIVSNRDGFHSYSVENGPLLKGCEISYTIDDSVAIHGFFTPVIRIIDARTVHLLWLFGWTANEGDLLSFYDQEGRPLGSRSVVRVEKLPEVEGQKELDAWRAAIKSAGARTLRGIPRNQWVAARVELDGEIELGDFAMADSGRFSGAGAEIRDCYIHDTTSRGMLISSVGTKIIGNRIERTGLTPIALMAERYWLQGPFPDQIEVSGNTIIDAPLPALDTLDFHYYNVGAIHVSSIFGTRFYDPPEFNEHRQNRRIRIIDNHIIRPAWSGIAVLNAEEVVVSGNRIESPFAAGIAGNPLNLLRTLAPSGPAPASGQGEVAAKPWYGILLMASGNVEVARNTVVKAQRGVLGPVGVGPWTDDIRLEENRMDE